MTKENLYALTDAQIDLIKYTVDVAENEGAIDNDERIEILIESLSTPIAQEQAGRWEPVAGGWIHESSVGGIIVDDSPNDFVKGVTTLYAPKVHSSSITVSIAPEDYIFPVLSSNVPLPDNVRFCRFIPDNPST